MGITQTPSAGMEQRPSRSLPSAAFGARWNEIDAVFAIRHALLLAYSLLWVIERPRPFVWWEPVLNILLVIAYSGSCHLAARVRGTVPRWVPWSALLIAMAWLSAMPTVIDVPLLIWVAMIVVMAIDRHVARTFQPE